MLLYGVVNKANSFLKITIISKFIQAVYKFTSHYAIWT